MNRRLVAYGLLSVLMLGIALLAGYYLFENAERFSPDTDARGYYLILIVASLAASLCLFGVLRSTATLTGEGFGNRWELGGSAALFAIVLFGGMWVTKPPELFSLNIQLRSIEPIAEVSQDASIVLFLGTEPRIAEFNSVGSATINEVPSNYKGKSVDLEFRSDKFKLKDDAPATIPTEGGLEIEVELDETALRATQKEPLLAELSQIMMLINRSMHEKNQLIDKISEFQEKPSERVWEEVVTLARADVLTIETGLAALDQYDMSLFEVDGSVLILKVGSMGASIDHAYYQIGDRVRNQWNAKRDYNNLFAGRPFDEVIEIKREVADWKARLKFTYQELGNELTRMIEIVRST
jgi:hypothetical protein